MLETQKEGGGENAAEQQHFGRQEDQHAEVFGLAPISEDKEHKILRLGARRTVVSLRQEPPAGTVDHFAIAVEGFNRAAVTETLKPHGLTPQENIEYGFYINDPDGVHVQIV